MILWVRKEIKMTNLTHKIGFKNNCFEVIRYHKQLGSPRFDHLWVCKCSCSKEFIIPTDKLKYQKHCGDKTKHVQKHGLTKKGQKFHPLYRMWCNIKKRCYNSEPREFKYYQGQGIKMFDQWINDPLSFYNWAMESGWKQGLSIDRIDSNKDYVPDNCHFITRSENSRKASVKRWENR